MNETSKKRWEITGILATIVIILTVPLYLLKVNYLALSSDQISSESTPTFVGRDKCIDCHRKEYRKWQNSHHDKAMDVATGETVLGDFNNAVFEHKGIKTRFFKKEDKFFVNTQGPDGTLKDFQISHTFGFTPLQQYLVPFPGGRLQCLSIAWDDEKKQWYHLYPDGPVDPSDWLHWTQNAQNWNGMCAECHSTHLQKNYDMKTDTYKTIWSEIDVSCEACHGPGSRHVGWAEVSEMARNQDVDNYGLVVNTGNMDTRQQMELCARCHARRSSLGDYDHAGKDPMDYMIPQLLSESMYYPDGQILDEVYVYGSFIQSKMYKNGVMCRDCHDVHSLERHKDGNDLCLQCHQAKLYDTKTHHFHKKKGENGDPVKAEDGTVLSAVGEGALCVNCHMPGRYYMGIDFRNDHSLRIPRPDLSIAHGTPNACNACHSDKAGQWSVDHFTKWYGISRKPHYGTIIIAGRQGDPEVQAYLIELVDDMLSPPIVRATALQLLGAYPGETSLRVFERALSDSESMVRHTAVHNMFPMNPDDRKRLIVPLLYDPVKAVRIEAAMNLTSMPLEKLNERQRALFMKVIKDYQQSMAYVGDFPHGQFNLGNMFMNLGRREDAEAYFKGAANIDRLFYPAKINLAMLYSQTGRNDEAENLFREVVEDHPELYEAFYSLGLLLVEQKKYREAVGFLEKAAAGIPEYARVHYNLGILFEHQERWPEAEASLRRAHDLEPDTLDFLYALADLYMRVKNLPNARHMVELIMEKHPDTGLGQKLMPFIEKMEREE